MEAKKIKKSLFQEFITEQIEKWEDLRLKKHRKEDLRIPVITVSSEPGSDGSVIAQKIADRLGLDFFNREMVREIAESVDIAPDVIERIEKERMSGIEDFLSSLVRDRYLWPGMYLDHLKKVVETIGRLGGAVIVGRGANFILATEEKLSLRVVAPFDLRVRNIAHRFDVSIKEAKQRVVNREKKRRAFIKKSFQKDVSDPLHYDFVINTGRRSVQDAVDAVTLLWGKKYFLTPKTDKKNRKK